MAFTEVTNAHGPSPQLTACRSQHGVLQPQQDVTRPKAWFKPTLAEKSVVNWRTNQLPQLHSSSYLVER